ncbi:MAG TPA: LamG-like jellyroll fold domain-containing protein [Pirellulaceae bacterium]|nr:LamG-like jellyroll fold domain-containing protein [Pirellulaceae bacterium]
MRTNFYCVGGLLLLANIACAQEDVSLGATLLFHASFDQSADADFSKGDGKIYTAASLKRENVQAGLPNQSVSLNRKHGRYGGSLMFTKKSDKIVFFKGAENLPAAKKQEFQGSYSFWLSLTPEEDLPPGYVDPLQITDKKWNDASFYVDFTKETPRKFRLGVFSDYKFWNPQNRKWDDIPDSQRPIGTVDQPPFSRDRWTHVGITFRDFNAEQKLGMATLYLNGERHGDIRRRQRFTWDTGRLAIMLGINYVGQIDDFAIFDRALTASEMKQIFQLRNGIVSLRQATQKTPKQK